MKRASKILLLLAGIGLAGVLATLAVTFATGAIWSYEDSISLSVEGEVYEAVLDVPGASVQLAAADHDYRVEAFSSAWLTQPLPLSNRISAYVKEGTLYVGITPFPDTFLGMFPQPHETRLTLYLPAHTTLRNQEMQP